jgi:hypothetical protein
VIVIVMTEGVFGISRLAAAAARHNNGFSVRRKTKTENNKVLQILEITVLDGKRREPKKVNCYNCSNVKYFLVVIE